MTALKNEITTDLNFPAFEYVATLLTVAHLFGKTKPRCGIYLLAFANGSFYIGQAVEVVRRFSQHRKSHDDIVGFSFIAVKKTELDTQEKQLIQQAESAGYLLRNVIHVTSLAVDADFDELMSLSEQDAWLLADFALALPHEFKRQVFLPLEQTQRFEKNFNQYRKLPHETEASKILGYYLKNCIPAFRKSEYSFWSVSCTPSTNANTYPRLFAVNAASMELMVCGWIKKTNEAWALVTVAEDILSEHWPDPEVFSARFPNVQFIERNYRDAGHSQITLHMTDLQQFLEMLLDPGVTAASSTLALRVMRKRSNFYAQFHCEQLVDWVITSNLSSASENQTSK